MLPRSRAPRPNWLPELVKTTGKRSFYSAALPVRPGRNLPLGGERASGARGVSLRQPWGRHSRVLQERTCCGEGEVGKWLMKQRGQARGRGRSWQGWKRQEGDARSRRESVP